MPNRIDGPPKEVLVKLYEVDHLTSIQIAELYGVSKPVVLRWLRKEGIELRPAGRGMVAQGKRQPTREELMKWIHEDHLSHQEIANMFGTTLQAVSYWVNKYDVPPPTAEMKRTTRWYREKEPPQLPTKEEFLQMYEQEGMSVEHIARKLDIPFATLLYFCQKEGIDRRPNGWQKGKRYECQDGHIVRSVYEQRIDDWLYAHEIPHVVEPLLPFGGRYRSDFLANGWYIEIWGVTKNLKYLERKSRKLAQYKEHNLPLIQIGVHYFDNPRKEPWARVLQKFLL